VELSPGQLPFLCHARHSVSAAPHMKGLFDVSWSSAKSQPTQAGLCTTDSSTRSSQEQKDSLLHYNKTPSHLPGPPSCTSSLPNPAQLLIVKGD
jgi:hypothetical protein